MADTSGRDGDRVLGFTLPGRSTRGRVVRLDQSLLQILEAHAYPDPIARLLSETLVLTSMLGALLRPEGGQLTVQARGTGGPVQLLVADFREGAIRGYASQDLDRRFPFGEGAMTLAQLFGKGQLAITLDQTLSSERYQGIVNLGDETLEKSAQGYFEDSEQVPTLVKLGAVRGEDGRWTAGGIILQQLARAEQDDTRLHVDNDPSQDWEHVVALASTLTEVELSDTQLPLESLLWRLFHEDEVRVQPAVALSRGCRCSPDHIRQVLSQFPEVERADMRNDEGMISVDCEFCSKQFLLEI